MKTHRLQELADKLGLSVIDLEKEVKAGVTTIGSAIRRNSKVSKGIASMITERYPNINKEWLNEKSDKWLLIPDMAADYKAGSGGYSDDVLTKQYEDLLNSNDIPEFYKNRIRLFIDILRIKDNTIAFQQEEISKLKKENAALKADLVKIKK